MFKKKITSANSTNENSTNVMGDIWNILREVDLRTAEENRSKSPFLKTF